MRGRRLAFGRQVLASWLDHANLTRRYLQRSLMHAIAIDLPAALRRGIFDRNSTTQQLQQQALAVCKAMLSERKTTQCVSLCSIVRTRA
jgi:hypothetical protein